MRDDAWDEKILAQQIADSLVNNEGNPADFVLLLIERINLHEVAQEVHKKTSWAKYDPDPVFVS